jgi:hypothetical protein
MSAGKAILRDSLMVQDDWMHPVAALLNLASPQRHVASTDAQADWPTAVVKQSR